MATPKRFIILGIIILLANVSFSQSSKVAKANNQFDKC